MTTVTTSAKIIILGLIIWGGIVVGMFPVRNGFLPIFMKYFESGLLHESQVPMRTRFTGIAYVDAYLTGLGAFFWMMVNGHCPDVSLHSIEFLGQGAAIWVVIMIEGSRAGNRGKLVSFVTTLGIIIQCASLSINMPAYLAVHLFTSPTVSGLSPSALLSKTTTLNSIIPSMVVGYLVPVLMMSLPAPSVLSYKQKQMWIAIFQPFPALVYIISSVRSAYLSLTQPIKERVPQARARYIKALRRAYTFGLSSAVICHMGSWTLSLTAAFFPQLFTPELAAAWHPSMVFQVMWPFSGVQVPSLSRGAIWMLQWGLLNGSIALLVWATTLYINASVAQKKQAGLVSTLGKAAVMTLIGGPCGAALLLVWERDELMFDVTAVEKKVS